MYNHIDEPVKTCSYTPNGIKSSGVKTYSVHYAQYARHHLRQTCPPMMHLDNALLVTDLRDHEVPSMGNTSQTPRASPPSDGPFYCTELVDDGMISPLELPLRLLTFGTNNDGDTRSFLLGKDVELDLDELDRRLKSIACNNHSVEVDLTDFDRRHESIARLERLGRAGVLNAFFASVSAT